MYGVPGMRSAVLPTKAYLNASRLGFAARLRVRANRTAYAIFGDCAKGGELISRIQPSLPLWSAKEAEARPQGRG